MGDALAYDGCYDEIFEFYLLMQDPRSYDVRQYWQITEYSKEKRHNPS